MWLPTLRLSTCVLYVLSLTYIYADTNTEPDAAAGPVVVTPMGVIRGSWMVSRQKKQFGAFRGIHYAEPPVGNLRFQPPKPVQRYSKEVDASSEGPACPLPVSVPYDLSEDCLRLNVYTANLNRNTSGLLPVVVYIHAGGFYSFSGRSDVAGPHYLLDRDVVLVVLNYRLATLGFLSTGDSLAPGNNGLKDQVVALRWVQRNIAAFGGDPNLVTIAGCSAGSFSVLLHMISPMSQGLFHRAISVSGSVVDKGPNPTNLRQLAVKQAELVNCPTNSSKAIIDCLKTKPWKEIADTLDSFFEFGFDPVLLWQPVVEPDFGQERFLPLQPAEAIRSGKIHAVPYIISQTEAEFFWKAFTILKNETLLTGMNNEWERVAPISFQLPKQGAKQASNSLKHFYLHDQPITNDTRSASNLGRLYADAITSFPVHRLANLMAQYSPQPVYYYVFDYIGNHSHYEDPVTGKPTAPAHHDDLIYLFSLRYRFPDISLSGRDATMVDRMTAIYSNFAKYGDVKSREEFPELSSLCWPRMKPDSQKYLRFGQEFSVGTKYGEDRFQEWERLYPIRNLFKT